MRYTETFLKSNAIIAQYKTNSYTFSLISIISAFSKRSQSFTVKDVRVL